VKKALELDPLSMVVNTNVGWTLQYAGGTEEAMEAYHAALALDPTYVQAHMRLGNAYVSLGRAADAVREAETVAKLTGGSPAGLTDATASPRTPARVDM
jgi:Flp pilus assembly protein TadD